MAAWRPPRTTPKNQEGTTTGECWAVLKRRRRDENAEQTGGFHIDSDPSELGQWVANLPQANDGRHFPQGLDGLANALTPYAVLSLSTGSLPHPPAELVPGRIHQVPVTAKDVSSARSRHAVNLGHG